MPDPISFTAYSAANGQPLAGLVPTATAKRRNADNSYTDLGSRNAVDLGGGNYGVTFTDAEVPFNTTAHYIIDLDQGQQLTTTRYLDGDLPGRTIVTPTPPPAALVINLIVKAGDLLPSVTATLADGRPGISLTGATVQFRMVAYGSSTLLFTRNAVIVDPVARTVRYDWQAGDTATPGVYQGEFVVTNGPQTMTYPADGYLAIEIATPL